MDVLMQLDIYHDLFLQMFVGPNNAIAASFITMTGMAITFVVDKLSSDEK
ncbi:hypothetical protein [Macrococcoides caseolyticum]|nr:hypothetical protein [Macrococcus caseolyticus]MDJ1091740.1 hypothetical protein [Macrococcus caseolyticus]MDJ1154171.1 hypothetical protein [Macrococcus caseolyticus]QPT46194.1 hypothetical protein I6G25_08270 [Macrococcus caseolyticus]QYA35184.1 hypothetical protein KYI08_11155 [Macrococcus caseolyticus]QYA39903.1 hypothetical protein KYI09_10150 [Macrococcus caseolyticus]